MMDLDRAHAMLTESVALEEAAGDTRGLAFALQSLANLECQRGHPEVAEAHLRRSLALWREVGDRAFLPLLLEAFAVQAAASAESARALRLAAVASSLREQMDVLCPPIWLPRLNGWLASARSALGEQAGAEAWQAGLGLSPEAAIAEALEPPRTRPDQPPLPVAARTGLTRRESEVLQLVAGGATNKEIANQLTLSVATVERHIANLYAKIGARGRAEATAFAITRGLVRPPSA
jgi:DNA-binding CsgD family transcriptional regulator